jgi:hypothetical protein
MTAAEHYTRNVVINQYDWTRELSWLIAPAAGAVGLTVVAILIAPRFLSLRGGAEG